MSNLYSRRSILKKAPAGLGLAAGAGTGLLTLDSARTSAHASDEEPKYGKTNFQESPEFYNDTWDQRCSFKTWDYQADSSSPAYRYAEVYNQYDGRVAQDSMKLWRLQDETLDNMNDMVLESYDDDQQLRYKDDGLILSDLDHAEEHRRLLDEPNWGDDAMYVGGLPCTASDTFSALNGRLHWREFHPFLNDQDVRGLEVQFQQADGSLRIIRMNADTHRTPYPNALEAIRRLRVAWQRVHAGAWAAGGAGTTGGASFASGAYLAGAVTVKGGAALGTAVGAGGALLTMGAILLFLALAAAAALAAFAAIAFDQHQILRFHMGADDGPFS